MARTASSNTSRLVSMSRPNGVSSVIEALSPIPNSTRPLLRRSSTATRSATRAGWLVVKNAVAEPDVFGALAGGGEKGFRRRRMRIFLQEMKFHHPGVIVAEPVGGLQLRQRILIKPE